jgi:protein-L-isoaspartate(D-aspartate) O-methyltransferase
MLRKGGAFSSSSSRCQTMIEPDRTSERARMVKAQLRARGVSDERVLSAMGRVPRERFVPPLMASQAYADHAMAIGHHQTISQPYMVAVMTEALALTGSERVLEVGTGSGYQCAILAELAGEVYSMERVEDLARAALDLLTDELGYANVHVRSGDGTLGWPDAAPFQGVIVTAAAPGPPHSLLEQLDPDGGRLVVPVGDHDLQHLVRVERHGTEFTSERTTACRFVPLVGAEGWKQE